MNELKKDSESIQFLHLKSYEEIETSFPNIDLDLLIDYYSGELIEDNELIKLAEDMNYLKCGRLDEVLIKLRKTFPKENYFVLNPKLVEKINELDKFTQIACGESYIIALRKDGTIASWNSNHQRISSPTGEYTAIACGHSHLVALGKDETIITWGNNSYNQKDGSPSSEGYIAIACGYSHSVALKSDGTIVTWGDRRIYCNLGK